VDAGDVSARHQGRLTEPSGTFVTSGVSEPASRSDELTDGWEVARSAPGECEDPKGLGGLGWLAAQVPGTAAGAVGDRWLDSDAEDWWFRVQFAAEPAKPGEEVILMLGGMATVAEVYLNGRRVLDSESMFAAHAVDVGALLRNRNELVICCRALAPLLTARRRPRARWRTRLVTAGNVRFYRTMLLGRSPGLPAGPAVVGPWRPVALTRRRGTVAEAVRWRARLEGTTGVLRCSARLRTLPGGRLPESVELVARGATGEHRVRLAVEPDDGGGVVAGELVVEAAARWWPHTHGAPALYDVSLGDVTTMWDRRRVGFRVLESAADLVADGPDLRVNGQRVFARGAVWTPLSLTHPCAGEAQLRAVLGKLVDGGLNMVRVAGIGAYENDAFYDLCDELGILVWQDFMFANLDYPESDETFMGVVRREAEEVMARLAPRPSLAVMCGGSEVAQQVAMLGLDPALAHGPLYGELLPSVVADAEVEAPYVPSAPWGGDLPFRTDRGVANYYGIGAYRRPLSDARLAQVRFAAESLAFANVPDPEALADVTAAGAEVSGPGWKAGVPRDAGAGWDFDDVRDHYLETLFELDPVTLRSADPERYLELSRAVSGEVMAETFGEWRRQHSPCRGALVLWCKDLRPGAGWGVLDHRGEPKVAYHHLRRALAATAVWSTDEGLGGIAVHVANDRDEPLRVRLRVALYRYFEQLVDEVASDLELAPHGGWEGNIESMLGHFVDVNWAYRFGSPAQDLIALSLEHEGELLSQSFRFPVGRPQARVPASRIRLAGRARRTGETVTVRVASGAFAYGVRVHVPGYAPRDDAFGVEPGRERVIELVPLGDPAWPPAGAALTALNVAGRVRIELDDDEPTVS
jgi:beta-mannosidase